MDDDQKRTEMFDRRALDAMAGALNCGVMISAEDAAEAFINDRLAEYCGYAKEEFVRRFPRFIDCVHPDDQLFSQRLIKKALDHGGRYEVIYRVTHKDGHTVWLRENGSRVTMPNGESAVVSVLVDISPDMAQRRNMENMSISDPLTGILNRDTFIDGMRGLLSDSSSKSVKHALIMFDVDEFKEINKLLGHDKGDQILKDITRCVRSTIRSADLFGRLGGDEFMLCLRDIAVDNAFHRRMEQIRAIVNRQIGDGLSVSCSLGIAIFRQDGEDFETLSNCANIALYEAKRRGRNMFVMYRKGMGGTGFMPHMTPIDQSVEM